MGLRGEQAVGLAQAAREVTGGWGPSGAPNARPEPPREGREPDRARLSATLGERAPKLAGAPISAKQAGITRSVGGGRPDGKQYRCPLCRKFNETPIDGRSLQGLQAPIDEAAVDKLDAKDRALLARCADGFDVDSLDADDLRRAAWLLHHRMLQTFVSYDDVVTLRTAYEALRAIRGRR